MTPKDPQTDSITEATELLRDRIEYLQQNSDFAVSLFVNLVGYAIIAADFDGNIIAYNEGARLIYGYDPEEVIGKKNIEIFLPNEFVESGKFQEITNQLIGEGHFSHEGERIRKDGSLFPARVFYTLTRGKAGDLFGFIEIVQDLTEQKQAEEDRVKARRVEQLEQELQNLTRLAGPSKTTVTAQMYGLKLLRENPDTFNDFVREYSELLELAIEQRVINVDHNLSDKLRKLSEELAFLRVGPRDVIDIHTNALKIKTGKDTNQQKANVYYTEARLLVLELMGNLVSCYRRYSH